MWKAHYVFYFLFSCLTIVRIKGFREYGVSGKCLLWLPFLNGGKIQDGRHLCKAKQLIATISPQKLNRFMILVSTGF